jgi:predicted unusual protein kinase regulating ubiquinone biosynthesis (AarF/ABC1/UbiB family)
MAQDYYALDFLSRDVDVSPIVPALRNFFDDALNYTVSELNFRTIVDGLGNVLYEYPFNGEIMLCFSMTNHLPNFHCLY